MENYVFILRYFNVNSYDTISVSGDLIGTATLPSLLKVGLTYKFEPADDTTKNRINKPSYMLTMESGTTDWANFQRTINNQSDTVGLNTATSLRLGFQFTPHRNALDRSTFIKYYSKMSYRVGYYTSKLPFSANNAQLDEFGISFGLGLPVVVSRGISSVNLGVNYGNRGNGNTNSIQENFWGVSFGVHLSPGYDRWFRKYKYD